MSKKYYKKTRKKNKVGKIIGWTLLACLVAGVVCYFAVPSFHTWINNGWTELFKK